METPHRSDGATAIAPSALSSAAMPSHAGNIVPTPRDPLPSTSLWMRPVSFAGLLRLLKMVACYPNGIQAHQLNAEVRETGVQLTRQSTPPAPTTLYHYRNTLLHLGALRRQNGKLIAAHEVPEVAALLAEESRSGEGLSATARLAFSELVLGNVDCRLLFFDLFMPDRQSYNVEQFRQHGRPISWEATPLAPHRRRIVLRAEHDTRSVCSEQEIAAQSILYGVRAWARDQLRLVDELPHGVRGGQLFPIAVEAGVTPLDNIVQDIFDTLTFDGEWATVSISNLCWCCCVKRRRPVDDLFRALRWLSATNPGHVVLIPTSRSFATLTAGTQARAAFELRRYFQDVQGRYISHLRIHHALLEGTKWQTSLSLVSV